MHVIVGEVKRNERYLIIMQPVASLNKASGFRVTHANGAWLETDSQGEVHLLFYSEPSLDRNLKELEIDLILSRNAVAALEETLRNNFHPTHQPIQEEFRTLADQWYESLGAHSSLTKMTSDINYLKIIALEPRARVISLILEELTTTCAPWFLALQLLSRNLGVGREYAGNFEATADAWLKWGRENGYK